MKLLAIIQDKTITFRNNTYARHHLEKLEGQKVMVTVEKVHNKRSLNQNKYYWICLAIIANHTGHTEDELHRVFKGKFLPRKELILNGQTYSMAGSTQELTKGEFVEYLMRIFAEAGQMGIYLPSAEDYKKGLDMAVLSTD